MKTVVSLSLIHISVPTGTVVFALKDTDENRSVNVSNVEKVEKLLDKNEVLYQVSAIPETSMLSSVLLPTVITLGGIMLLLSLIHIYLPFCIKIWKNWL